MSFNFGNNGMASMLPLLANINNGNNFLHQPMPGGQTLSTAGLLQPPRATPYNDSPLEFKSKTILDSSTAANLIDLDERDSHMLLMDQNFKNHSDITKSVVERRSDDTTNDCNEKQFSFGQNDVMFNGMVGLPPQGFMVMPGVMNMLDPTAAMIGMQQISQYPVLNQLNQTLQSPTSTSLTESNATNTNTANTPSKETINCKSCILVPPFKNAPAPTTRERPSGCRTVFVGGLPENITEDIIREVFERCGEITTLRLSKKNFCHIRFMFEASVDSAIYLSGYRIRINGMSDAPNCSRLHVDYAQARDDQYEWECKQRQLQREQRHRERVERDRMRPLSPPPIIHFTEHEAVSVSEKLKTDDSFSKAVQVLITWLERGDCNKKNSNAFYSMIQSTNAHVRRLMNEKPAFDEEMRKARELHRKQMLSLNVQFSQIEKVFGAASHKKVWDHFTKAQRKNIDLWKKQSTDWHRTASPVQSEDGRDTDEMDLSDDDDDDEPVRSKRFKMYSKNYQSYDGNKIDLTTSPSDSTKSSTNTENNLKDQQMKVLHETIRNLQTQLIENKAKERESMSKISNLEEKLKQANVKELLLKTRIVEVTKQHMNQKPSSSDIEISENDTDKEDDNDCIRVITPPQMTIAPSTESMQRNSNGILTSGKPIQADEARLIGLVSTFLVVHPFGASLDYVFSYVQRLSPFIRPKELEEILSRYTTIFCEEVSGVGAQIERKWKFCGFNTTADATTIT